VTVGELIERLGGELLRGDPDTLLAGVADIALAKGLDLVFGENDAAADLALCSWPPSFQRATVPHWTLG